MADDVVVDPNEPVEVPLQEPTREELAAQIAAEQARLAGESLQPGEAAPPLAIAPPPTKAAGQTFEYRATDGTVYTAASQDELLSKVTGALDHTKTALRDRERQIHDLRQKPAEQPKPATPTDAFDNTKYLSLLETNAVEAQTYLDRFTPKGEEPQWAKDVQTQMEAQRNAARVRDEITRFYASPAGQQYAKVESPELNSALIAYMDQNNLPRTAESFRLAFFELREAGTITPPKETRRPKAPPAAPRGGGNDYQAEEPEPDILNMPKEEAIKYLRSKGIAVHLPS